MPVVEPKQFPPVSSVLPEGGQGDIRGLLFFIMSLSGQHDYINVKMYCFDKNKSGKG